MTRAFVDANVILRFLTNDPPDMAKAALKMFKEAQSGDISIIITTITIAEVIWVLESFYSFSKQKIAEILSQFLCSKGLEVQDLEMLIQALTLYKDKNIDFADALLSTTAITTGINRVYSFDRHFNRIPELTRLDPGGLQD